MAHEKLNYERYPVGSDMYLALKAMSEAPVKYVVHYGKDSSKVFEDKAKAQTFATGKRYRGKPAAVATYAA
jgi:hypothetical protein